MKIRIGFVSNSSSSSFVVHKDGLTEKQLAVLQGYPNNKSSAGIRFLDIMCGECFYKDWTEALQKEVWDKTETEDRFEFFCIIDNFPLPEYLVGAGIPVKRLVDVDWNKAYKEEVQEKYNEMM